MLEMRTRMAKHIRMAGYAIAGLAAVALLMELL